MKRRLRKASPLVWGLSVAACSGSNDQATNVGSPTPTASVTSSTHTVVTSPRPPMTSSSVANEPPPGDMIDLGAELTRRSVGGTQVVHNVLYSWTTQAQLTELQKGSPLLSRATSATRGPAAFDDLLASESERGRDVAKLLFAEGFAKKRFAWPNAFATVTGEADGPYGDVLLRIELKHDAWILDYATGAVFGVDGSQGKQIDAIGHPERIAAVFFNGEGYREFVLVNESMILRWSAGSAPDVTKALTDEIAFLGAAANAIDEDRATTPGIPSSTATVLQQSLAFNRKLSEIDLRDRAKTLERIRSMPHIALSQTPTATFTFGKRRIPGLPVCKIVRKQTTKEPQFIGSFTRPARTMFTPVCGPANPSVICIPNEAPKSSEALCTPQPAFGE